MGLIIAVLGGIWLAGKIMSDKSSRRRNAARSKNIQEIRDERYSLWRAVAGHMALEEDLRDFILGVANIDDVWREVRSAYLHMQLHRDYAKIEQANMANINRDAALHIMLARRGKVPVKYTKPDTTIDSFAPGFGKRTRREWDMKYEFWGYIEDELNRYGVKARLLFLRKIQKQGSVHSYDVREVACDYKKAPRYSAGYIMWFHQTLYAEDLSKELYH